MNRVLVTGGAGTIGAAVVRRLLRDPAYEVRVSDQRAAPQWMREGCEIHQGDLRQLDEARKAGRGCSHVIHLAAIVGGVDTATTSPHTMVEVNNALYNSVIRSALDQAVERFVYVSSAMVYERATVFPTSETDLTGTAIPASVYGFSKLMGEVAVKAAHTEHGFPYTICRPFNAYGPGERVAGEPAASHLVLDVIRKCLAIDPAAPTPLTIIGDGSQTRTLTHIDDVADGIVAAMGAPAGLHEDFNIAATQELSVAEIARLIWEQCGLDPDAFALEHLPSPEGDVMRRWPDVSKAERLLDWKAQIGVREGVAQTADWLRSTLVPA